MSDKQNADRARAREELRLRREFMQNLAHDAELSDQSRGEMRLKVGEFEDTLPGRLDKVEDDHLDNAEVTRRIRERRGA